MDQIDMMGLLLQNPGLQRSPAGEDVNPVALPVTQMMYPQAENPFSPLGLMSVTKTVKKGSGTEPMTQADYLQKQLQAMNVEGLAQQQEGIKAYEKQLKDLTASQAPNPWAVVASGLSDFYSGTKNLDKLAAQQAQQKQLALMGTEKVQKAKNDIAENQRNLIKDQLDYEKAREKNAADEERTRQMFGLAQQRAKDKVMPGQEQADKDFAKEYVEWNQKGGRAGYIKSKQDLADSLAELTSNPSLSGTAAMKATPASMVSKFHSDSARVEQKVKSTIISMVKQLGANPTDTDLREIQKTVWDKDLPVSMNIEKIQSYLQQLETQAAAKDQASRFFEQSRGTLLNNGMATNRPVTGGLSADQEKRRQELLKKASGGR